MVWCSICQDYHESHDEHEDSRPTLLPFERVEPAGEYENVGNWNVTDFGWVIGACHSPEFDTLMTRLRLLERAVQEDEPRVRKLIKPWLGDAKHNQLKRDMQAARNRARAYLREHRDMIIID